MKMHGWLTYIIMLQIFTVVVTGDSNRDAFLEIILYEINQDSGKYTTHKIDITGQFSNAGSSNPAEGDIVQIHPFSLCGDSDHGDNDDEIFAYGWVGVVKLAHEAKDPCHSLIDKARTAVDKGATAVIFDVSGHPDAFRQLNKDSTTMLNSPVVLVKGNEALELMKLIENKQIARARIKKSLPIQDAPGSHFFDMGIFMACLILIFILCLIVIAKVRCWRRQRQITLQDLALEALQHMKTKKYRKHKMTSDNLDDISNMKGSRNMDAFIDCSSGSMCAICLEEFTEGQELRVVPCLHEFHKKCIDPWLKQKWTCPLCNRNFLRDVTEQYRQHQLQQQSNNNAGNSNPESVVVIEPRNHAMPHSGLSNQTASNNLVQNTRTVSEFPRPLQNNNDFRPTNHERTASVNQTNFNNYSRERQCTSHLYGNQICNTACNRCLYRGSQLSDFSQTDSASECEHHKPHFLHNTFNLYDRPPLGTNIFSKKSTSGETKSEENENGVNPFRLHNGKNKLFNSQTSHPPVIIDSSGAQKHGDEFLLQVGNRTNNILIGAAASGRLPVQYRLGHSKDLKLFPRQTPTISGYAPDSSDMSDCNSSPSKTERQLSILSPSVGFSCLNLNLPTVCENCRQQMNMLHSTSTQCVYGSLSHNRNCSFNSLASKSSPNQNNTVSDSCTVEVFAERIKLLSRESTPCIGYSSSDGMNDLGRLSSSSLEGVLEALDSSCAGFSS